MTAPDPFRGLLPVRLDSDDPSTWPDALVMVDGWSPTIGGWFPFSIDHGRADDAAETYSHWCLCVPRAARRVPPEQWPRAERRVRMTDADKTRAEGLLLAHADRMMSGTAADGERDALFGSLRED